MLPDSDAKTAADTALKAINDALGAVNEALGARATFGPGGTISFANMHTSLDRAQTAVDAARTALAEALDADPTDELRSLLAQAQAMLSTAQISLMPLLREELAEAEAEAAAQRARAKAQRARANTYDPRVPLSQALEPGATRFVPRGEVEITRTPRDADTPLAIRTDAVAFAAGKMLGSPEGGLALSDELPLRAVALRAHGSHPIKIQGDDGTPDEYGNTDGVVKSSLQLSADGATLKLGGAGVLYYDTQRRFDIGANKDEWWRTGPDGKVGDADASAGDAMTADHATDLGLDAASGQLTAEQATMLQGWATDRPACWEQDLSLCGDWNQDDLAIAFGAPSQSPHGEPAYYWRAKVPLTEAPARTAPAVGAGTGRPHGRQAADRARNLRALAVELWRPRHGRGRGRRRRRHAPLPRIRGPRPVHVLRQRESLAVLHPRAGVRLRLRRLRGRGRHEDGGALPDVDRRHVQGPHHGALPGERGISPTTSY